MQLFVQRITNHYYESKQYPNAVIFTVNFNSNEYHMFL